MAKMRELRLETLRQSPYTPDTNPHELPFCQSFDKFLIGELSNVYIDMIEAS